MRLRDAFNRPICGSPGAYIDVLERVSHDQNITQQCVSIRSLPMRYSPHLTHAPLRRLTGRYRRCLNLGSYNYLGFGDADSPCRDAVLETLQRFSVSTCSSRLDSGAFASTTVALARCSRSRRHDVSPRRARVSCRQVPWQTSGHGRRHGIWDKLHSYPCSGRQGRTNCIGFLQVSN